MKVRPLDQEQYWLSFECNSKNLEIWSRAYSKEEAKSLVELSKLETPRIKLIQIYRIITDIKGEVDLKEIKIEPPKIIKETGISADYWKFYIGKIQAIESGGLPIVAQCFRDFPVQRYAERFPQLEYFVDVVNDLNRQRVQRLDELAESTKQMTDSEKFTRADFISHVSEAHKLIRGYELTDILI